MLAFVMIALCVVLRVAPHPMNFTPLGATAVMAGRTMPRWLGILTACVAMFIGDAIAGYPLASSISLFVYAGFAIQVLLGYGLRRRRGGALAAAGLGAIAFFLVSNFGLWLTGDFFPHTAAGLTACFVSGLPFLARTLVGDLLWTVVLSLAYKAVAGSLASRRWLLVPADQVAAI